MDSIQLLQLGGLGLTAENARDRCRRLLFEINRLKISFDYVVVCGGITADAQPSSFEAASQFLEELAALMRTQSGPLKRRMLVVPGPSDYSHSADRTSLASFEEFYERFFGAGQDLESLSESGLIARRLRDLTLIGAQYSHGNGERESRRSLELLREGLEAEAVERAGLEYAVQGPVVLAAPESPLLDPLCSKETWNKHVRRAFHGIDLFLFGTGPVSFLPSEPFSFAPVTIGLGHQESSALRMNLIQFPRPASPRPHVGQQSHLRFDLNVTSYLVEPDGTDLWSYDYLAKKNHSAHSDETFLHKKFLEQLNARLDQNGFITIVGYGSVWRKVVANGLKSRRHIGDRKVTVEVFQVREYPPVRDMRDAPLVQEVRRFKDAPAAVNEGLRIALVTDEAFLRTELKHRDLFARLQDALKEFCTHNFRMLYLVSAYGIPSVSDEMNDRSCVKSGVQWLEPVDSETFEKLVENASLSVPVLRETLRRISGGYLGFISALFDAMKGQFVRWDPSSAVGRDESQELITLCLGAPALLKERTELLEFVAEQQSGHRLVGLILQRLRALEGTAARMNAPIRFSREELVARGIQPEHLAGLIDAEILSAGARGYELRERIPFLVQLLHPAPPPSIFIGYSEPDEEKARDLVRRLKSLGFDTWTYSDAVQVKRRLKDEIMEKLRASSLVVIIWTKESIKSKYVIKEAKEAAKPSKPKLLNWWVDVAPKSVRETIKESLKEKRPASSLHAVLETFKENLGKKTIEDVVDTIVAQLQPFDEQVGFGEGRAEGANNAGR